ncbi:methyl-accepting chemotaxis protein [Sutcliffiella cohnii]|uniref:Methyl-accepting chemotaxis protein n=1 Tax=Sutcliffiella cohnii TaxID=33932 RepID=A0A223KU88_9BACI|nr:MULTISPECIES: methyl-accepting chemotaxis protein [Sutcliffiella]AST92893.1 hypothetical protein BC6307_17165 [Sutcliffiella cohnii]MED4016150.1 methyl-accepting chemotaxis protein [Sutcliffiella cohnii]WBL14150.1 methyl-accepting chemotaxis protein [Sutcliffiella sp. NC1]
MKTIRGRVTFILLTSIIGFAIVLLCNFLFYFVQSNAKQQETELLEAVNGSKEIKFLFADTRRSEQEFLRQPSEGLGNTIKLNIEEIVNMSNSLSEQFSDYSSLVEHFTSIEQSVTTYLEEFTQLESLYKEIGFDAYIGLRGEIHSTARNLTVNVSNNQELESTLLNIRLNEQQYLTTRQENAYRDFKSAAENLQSLLSENIAEGEEQSPAHNYLNLYVESMDQIYRNYTQSVGLIRNFGELSSTVENNVQEVENGVSTIQRDLQSDLDSRNQLIMTFSIIISIVILLFLSITGFFLNRNIRNSIQSLKDGAAKIGNGNFAYRVPITTKDEMADLAATFNKMAETMQSSLLKIMSASDNLHSASQNLAAISEETTAQSTEVNEAIKHVATGSSEQASHIEEGNTILINVKAAIDRTRLLSQEIKQKADQAQLTGEEGLTIVEELQSSSEQFLSLANLLTERIQQTSKQSQQINSIVGTIQEIAENTDLLALNATIESARAGDAGRGFAVVAQEVRKLAERSKEEAMNIKKLVSTISKQMDTLTEEAEQLSEYRNYQRKSVADTKNSFVNITSNVGEIHAKVSSVQIAVDEVNESNNSLAEKLTEVQYISEQAAATSEEVSASSEHQIAAIEQVNEAAISLSDIATELQDEVNQFIVEEHAHNELEEELSEDEEHVEEELDAGKENTDETHNEQFNEPKK